MVKVGIPRSIFYYYDKDLIIPFFDYLKIPYIISPKTNKEIIKRGNFVSSSEMCIALKIYLGHIDYLKDKCDIVYVPRICNYGKEKGMCTNFMSIYDLVNNIFKIKILNYNIDYKKNKTLKKGLIKIGKNLKCKDLKKAYKYALTSYKKSKKREVSINENNLNSKKTKILLMSHPYIIYDEISSQIIKYLKKNNIEIIYSDKFENKSKLSKKISKDIYFHYPKEYLGNLVYALDKIDGIIFVSVFPCALDSLVTEIIQRNINKPFLNLIIDDSDSFTGIETRLESFVDIIKEDL